MKPSKKVFWVDEGLTVLLAGDNLRMQGHTKRPFTVKLKDEKQRNSIAYTFRRVADELEGQAKGLGQRK
jgi:hypothetical protein